MTNQSRISYYVSVKVDNTFLDDRYSQEYPTNLFDVLEGYQVQKNVYSRFMYSHTKLLNNVYSLT